METMDDRQKNEAAKTVAVPKRILTSLLASLAAGVVPRTGAPYIAIGRREEIAAFLSDLENVSEGGSGMRFLIGRYGSGKSFLMQLIRGYALERDFITADTDLSPERRLYGTGGSGVATYRELIRNLASKASPDGGALPQMLARWKLALEAEAQNCGKEGMQSLIYRKLQKVEAFIGGFDFSRVLSAYFAAMDTEDESAAGEQKSACLRWLRGEFANRTEARNALGFSVSMVVDDDNWFDFVKLWASLSHVMGYRGMVVFIDECVNLYKISHRISRENNYEKILSMFNDTLQGKAPGLELVLGGTPQFLEDTRRGLFSYEALRSRLCDSRFSLEGYKNLLGPVIRLRRLSDDELFALIMRATKLHVQQYRWEPPFGEGEMKQFLEICLKRAGADSMITPREMLRDYMTVLNILLQNPQASFSQVVGSALTQTTPPHTGRSAEGADGYDDEEPFPESGEDSSEKRGATAGRDTRRDFQPNDIDF